MSEVPVEKVEPAQLVHIYALCPKDDLGKYFYVGSTTQNLKDRLGQHLANARHEHMPQPTVGDKIRQFNFDIAITELETAPLSSRFSCECCWVTKLIEQGHALCNVQLAGWVDIVGRRPHRCLWCAGSNWMVSPEAATCEAYAKDIGKQLDSKIICPRCRIDGLAQDKQQTLSVYGDFEDTLFCPHCELDMSLKVSNV